MNKSELPRKTEKKLVLLDFFRSENLLIKSEENK